MAVPGRHKVEVDRSPTGIISAMDMSPGQYGEIVDNSMGNDGRVIGRLWESYQERKVGEQRFFALDNPRSTWNKPTFKVRLLRPDEVIKITVDQKKDYD